MHLVEVKELLMNDKSDVEERSEHKKQKRKFLIPVIACCVLLGGLASADYFLSNGKQVKWAGYGSDGKPQVKVDGKLTSATFNKDGRAVPDNYVSSKEKKETNSLGRMDVGGDSKYKHFKDTVPVFKDGKFTGKFANVFDDKPGDDGLGHSFYTKGKEAGTWTNTGGDAKWGGSRIDFTSSGPTPTSTSSSSSKKKSGSSSSNSSTNSGATTPTPPPAPTNILQSYSIEHNSAWEAVRTKNNRTQAQFYAGEKFVVKATTTFDATSVSVTFHFPQAAKDVSPAFRDSNDPARPNFAATFQLNKEDNFTWSGTFWKKYWAAIPDGTYSATITSTFQNGETRTANHTIQIKGSIVDFVDGVEKIAQ
ncbi:hypothetical protein [Effusibacillus lacus]|uniref:Uncharacterized protein n=1 Tax=Effusibacillus lacus TaxID=1348429 RepID=A0A292YQ59_9BACL|nr:hypothetical protein [Effusibacillus lacus]TCS73706.1 hypothetical protein EDD64_1166 [Effusibacillus lacus]GAX92078.1 hypothetical protein EFBL_3769 [Effusibacillus lacus]